MKKVSDILDKRTIKVDLKVKNKYEAVTKLSEALKNAGYINNVPSFVEDIYVREKEGITGIGDGIAIPHGKSNYVSNIGVAIGILSKPIDWETLDDLPINIVILFAVSNDNEAAHNQLKLLSLFASRLGKESVITKLKSARNVDDVVAALSMEEGSTI